MKRYLFYPHVSAFGGIERLIEAFVREGRAVAEDWTLLTFGETEQRPPCLPPSIPVETIPCTRGFLAERRALRQWLKARADDPPDQFLAFELRAALYLSLASPRWPYHLLICDTPRLLKRDISKRAFSFPLKGDSTDVGSYHLPSRLKGELTHRLIRLGVRHAASIQTNTQSLKTEIDALYGVSSIVNYPGSAPTEETSPLPGQQNALRESVRFLSVCRLEPSKRIDLLIEAFDSAAAELKCPAILTLIGDGSERGNLETQAASTGNPQRIRFAGFVSDEELESAYAEADIFVMPAVQGYGLPGLESLQRGLSLIVHADSGVAEILEGSPRVKIISGSCGSLSRAMVELANLHLDKKPLPQHCLDLPSDETWFTKARKLLDEKAFATRD